MGFEKRLCSPIVKQAVIKLGSDLAGESKEFVALHSGETEEHSLAIQYVCVTQPIGQPLSAGSQLNIDDTPIFNAMSSIH